MIDLVARALAVRLEAHQAGLQLYACGNTLRPTHMTRADWLPGGDTAEDGGVRRIAVVQAKGSLYLLPCCLRAAARFSRV